MSGPRLFDPLKMEERAMKGAKRALNKISQEKRRERARQPEEPQALPSGPTGPRLGGGAILVEGPGLEVAPGHDPLQRVDQADPIGVGTGQQGAASVRGTLLGSSDQTSPPDPWGRDPRLVADFRLFLIKVWRQLNLPDPTPLQLSIAWYLQHGPERSVIMGFRGVAKSWITAAYALWRLYCNPQHKVLVVSGSLKRAIAFTNFCHSLIREMPELTFLRPKPHQRQSAQAFDVGPATPDQTPSFHAAGITSQIVGFRADVIVPDDVETNTNSLTPLMREKVADAVKEFDAILKPGGVIKFLGTPHDYDSLYNKLGQRGYTLRIWPGRFPTQKQVRAYGDKLAPYVLHQLKKDPSLAKTSTEPSRFTDEDLAKRELSLGKSEFALQYMLDTSLADADRYPLKLADLIVMGLDARNGPDMVAWGKSTEIRLNDLPPLGFEGDFYYGPANTSKTFSKWNQVVGAIDGSGRGDDETALAIIAELNGMLFLLHCSGYRDGYSPATLAAIAQQCVKWNVSLLKIESNFGDGMFVSLLRPVLEEEWRKANEKRRKDDHGGTKLEEVRSGQVQKEKRILSVMEPVSQGHRLVVNVEVIEADYESIRSSEDGDEKRHRYSLFYQWTHLTRDRDSLDKDDRLDSVALCTGHFAPMLGVSPRGMAALREEERIQDELEKLFEEADDLGYEGPARRPPPPTRGGSRPSNLKPGRSHR